MRRIGFGPLAIVSLLLITSGCQSPDSATPTAAPLAAATPAATLPPLALPTAPAADIHIRLGQSVRLPTRLPPERWRLDADPTFWQPLPSKASAPVLAAIRVGSTDLVQSERPAADGSPARRRFVYHIVISP